MASKLTDKERRRVIDLLQEHGGNQYKVAKICGRNRSTVSRIAKAGGIASNVAVTKKATEAHEAFSEAERRQIVVDGLVKARKILTGITDAAELQKWSVAVGTLVDKDLLLSGKPTNISESRRGVALKDFFDEVDADISDQWGQLER